MTQGLTEPIKFPAPESAVAAPAQPQTDAPDIFERAALIQPPVIAGIRLQPFTVWHSWVLYCLRSPYRLGGEPTLMDTALALSVCATGMEGCDPVLARWLASPGWRIRRSIRVAMHGHKRVQDLLDRHIDAYMAAPHTMAVISGHGRGGVMKTCGCPPEWNLVRCLMQDYGMGEAEAWGLSYLKAACYKVMHDEACDGPTVGWRTDCAVDRKPLSGPDHPALKRMFGQGAL